MHIYTSWLHHGLFTSALYAQCTCFMQHLLLDPHRGCRLHAFDHITVHSQENVNFVRHLSWHLKTGHFAKCIGKLPLAWVAHEISQDIKEDMRWQTRAIAALHEMPENYIARLFEDCNKIVMNAAHVTIKRLICSWCWESKETHLQKIHKCNL